MKSSYELAMERLNKIAPTVKLTEGQKKRLAELDGECKAKIADREIFLNGKISKAQDKGDYEELTQLERQLTNDRKAIQAEFDEKKEKVRTESK